MSTLLADENDVTFLNIVSYLRENIFGLSLLLVCILIVITVDYINTLNMAMMTGQTSVVMPSIIPGGIQMPNIRKSRKTKKK